MLFRSEIGYKDIAAGDGMREFNFEDEELLFLKIQVDRLDKNGMFSEDTMLCYSKILDSEFKNNNVQIEWEKYQGIYELPELKQLPEVQTELKE